MNVYLDTLGLIALFAWMCSMYVRDLYRAFKDFEDFEGGGGL